MLHMGKRVYSPPPPPPPPPATSLSLNCGTKECEISI